MCLEPIGAWSDVVFRCGFFVACAAALQRRIASRSRSRRRSRRRRRRTSSATGPSADVAGGRLVVDHVNVTLGRLISLDESRAFSDTLCDGRRERSTTGPSHRQKTNKQKQKPLSAQRI